MTGVLAIDLGGTNMRAAHAVSDVAAMRPLEHGKAPASLDEFVARVSALRSACGAGSLGIAVPGLASGTVCRWIPNLPFLDGVDLQTLFPDMRIGLGNDAQIAMLAEARAGAAQGMTDAVLLAIGTGIGSAVLADGVIVGGSNGGACSFGWACADIDDRGTERDGWLERVASGKALDALARPAGLHDGIALIAAARTGDGGALKILDKPARQLGVVLAGVVGLLDTQGILISGGLADALDVLRPAILQSMRRQLPAHLRAIDIKAGAFGSRAGLVGAALAGMAGETWRRP